MGGGHCEGRKVINETGCRIPRCRRLIEKKEYKTWNLGFMREILNMFQICVYIKFIYTKTSINWGGVCLFVSFFPGGGTGTGHLMQACLIRSELRVRAALFCI